MKMREEEPYDEPEQVSFAASKQHMLEKMHTEHAVTAAKRQSQKERLRERDDRLKQAAAQRRLQEKAIEDAMAEIAALEAKTRTEIPRLPTLAPTPRVERLGEDDVEEELGPVILTSQNVVSSFPKDRMNYRSRKLLETGRSLRRINGAIDLARKRRGRPAPRFTLPIAKRAKVQKFSVKPRTLQSTFKDLFVTN